VFPEPGFTVMDSILVFVAGSYPTLIIVLVCMQKSPVDHYSTYSNGMQFARTPTGQRPGHMMPRQVNGIRREHATRNDSDTQVPSGIFATTLVLDQETNL